MYQRVALGLLLALGVGAAAADVSVKDAWVRGTVPAQKTTGAFMTLSSDSDAVVVSASTPVAGAVEIHSMQMEGGVMRMRAMPRLELPAGKAVELKPGGYHVMLMDLKRQLNKGDVVPLTLKVEGKDKSVKTVEIKAEVRDLAAAQSHMH